MLGLTEEGLISDPSLLLSVGVAIHATEDLKWLRCICLSLKEGKSEFNQPPIRKKCLLSIQTTLSTWINTKRFPKVFGEQCVGGGARERRDSPWRLPLAVFLAALSFSVSVALKQYDLLKNLDSMEQCNKAYY